MNDNKYEGERTQIIERLSWSEIAEAAASGKAKEIFSVGDEKRIALGNGEEVTVVIIGFNHDETPNGGRAGVTFATKDVLKKRYSINEENTNIGGWRESKMRIEYMEEFFNLLPEELRSVVKPVVKVTGIGGGNPFDDSGNVTERTVDKLFLFSGNELEGEEEYIDNGLVSGFYGPEEWAASNEGRQYPYFVERENRKVYLNGERESYWLRSPHIEDCTAFVFMYKGTRMDAMVAGEKSGVRIGFCV